MRCTAVGAATPSQHILQPYGFKCDRHRTTSNCVGNYSAESTVEAATTENCANNRAHTRNEILNTILILPARVHHSKHQKRATHSTVAIPQQGTRTGKQHTTTSRKHGQQVRSATHSRESLSRTPRRYKYRVSQPTKSNAAGLGDEPERPKKPGQKTRIIVIGIEHHARR